MDNLKTRIWPQPNIVVIGGGTGISTLLKGLKLQTENLTAIVTVADDGGSSGRLRKELGILAPGDIRSCLIALANKENKMKDLLKYRFNSGKLSGHSFGNIFIAAMAGIHEDYAQAIRETGKVLSITGQVLPVTTENMKLKAKLTNGEFVLGESKIPLISQKMSSSIEKIYLEPKDISITEDVYKAILEADLIIIGPGSLYTSIIPNILVNGLVSTVKKSKAKVIYLANIMTEAGETSKYNLREHIKAIETHGGEGILDYTLANNEKIDKETQYIYANSGSKPIRAEEEDKIFLKDKGITLLEGDLLYIRDNVIRHDYLKTSKKIMEIFF